MKISGASTFALSGKLPGKISIRCKDLGKLYYQLMLLTDTAITYRKITMVVITTTAGCWTNNLPDRCHVTIP